MFGNFEKINYSALFPYLGNALNAMRLFIFSADGKSGFYITVQNLFASITSEFSRIWTKLTEVEQIAKGAQQGIVFDSTAQLDSWIAGTYIRPDGVTPQNLKVGASIYILAEGEPDYWWTGTGYEEQEDKTNLQDYVAWADVEQSAGLSSPNKVMSQAAVVAMFSKYLKAVVDNTGTVWTVYAPNELDPLAPEQSLMVLSKASSFFGYSRAFFSNVFRNTINYASNRANAAIDITDNTIYINRLDGGAAATVDKDGNVGFFTIGSGAISFFNSAGNPILKLFNSGKLAIYSSGVPIAGVENGAISLTPTSQATTSESFICVDAAGKVKKEAVANFVKADEIAGIADDGKYAYDIGAGSQNPDFSVIIDVEVLQARSALIQIIGDTGYVQNGIPVKILRIDDNMLLSRVIIEYTEPIVGRDTISIIRTARYYQQ